MSLREFIDSVEVNDGLKTPGQVEELVTLMHEETIGEVKNAMHSSIARVITNTKSKACLDQFVNLGGTQYIVGWLDEALRSFADASEDLSEEFVALHLQALKQLHVDDQKLISSGVLDTIKSLCDHNSTKIKEKARELLDSWKDVGLNVALGDVEKVEVSGENDGVGVMPMTDEEGTLLEGSANMYSVDAAPEKAPDLEGSDCLLAVAVENMKSETTDSQKINPVPLDQADIKERNDGVINAGISGAECCVDSSAEGIVGTDSVNSLDSRQEMHEKKPNAHENNDNGNLADVVDSTSENLEVVSGKNTSDPLNFDDNSAAATFAIAAETLSVPKFQSNIDCREGGAYMKDGFSDDAKTVIAEKNRGLDDHGVQKSMSRRSLEKVGSPLGDLKEITATDSDVGLGVNSRVDDDYSKGSAIQNLARDSKSSTVADMRPGIHLDNGIIDALEVVREVAKAMEKETVDDRSSENKSDVCVRSVTHDSINEKGSQSGNLLEESSSELEMPTEHISERQVELTSSDKTGTEPATCMDVDRLEDSTQEVQVNSKRDMCEFDLNQEAACENVEFAVNFDHNTVEENGVQTINRATSQPASQFAGSDGWIESAVNSAFHPTSLTSAAVPADAPTLQCFLGIDLNVAGGGEDTDVISLSDKETASPFNILPSKLFVAGPRKSERLDLDLNSMSDVDDAPSSSSLRTDKQQWTNFKGHPSSSSASSLSSVQPMVNTDLNEGLPIQSIPSRLHPFFGASSTQSFNAHEDVKLVIPIMGARMEVGRMDFVFDAPSFPNGKDDKHVTEAAIRSMGSHLSVGRTGSHTYPSHFGYINMNTGPTMSFPAPIFAHGNTMTYRVDPSVCQVPQVAGSSPVIPATHTQPPFFTSMAGPYPSFNSIVNSGPDFDLNLGFKAGVNGQDMASSQLFISNQGRFIGEHMNPDSLSSSSSMKRKEPETGRETYPYNSKHHYPPGNR